MLLRKGFDKSRIATRFGQAAGQYDQHADFQRLTGDKLMAMMPEQVVAKGLDLGSGTGYFTEQLACRHQQQLGLDLSFGMLRYASHKSSQSIHWLNGDAEQLPFTDNSIDRIFSNLALQWCNDLRTPLAEIYRVLKPGGMAMMTTLVEGSLYELEQAWACVDDRQHVNRFVSKSTLQNWLNTVEFSQSQCLITPEVMHYSQLHDLTRSLKGIGANHVHGTSYLVQNTRHDLKRLVQAYEIFRAENGLLPATYQVAYIRLQK